MGLSELMRMIIIFVTFCLNKKKREGLQSVLRKVANSLKITPTIINWLKANSTGL